MRSPGIRLVLLLLLLTVQSALGLTQGFDTYLLQADMKCMYDKGYRFGIFRCYQEQGIYDANCVPNVELATYNGITPEVYMAPCLPCGGAEKQVDEMLAKLFGRQIARVWILVESPSWTTDKTKNRDFIQALVDRLEYRGKPVGVCTTKYYWEATMGMDYSELSSKPLWYVKNTGQGDCKDFVAFGGWKKAQYKSYDEVSECSSQVNKDIAC